MGGTGVAFNDEENERNANDEYGNEAAAFDPHMALDDEVEMEEEEIPDIELNDDVAPFLKG